MKHDLIVYSFFYCDNIFFYLTKIPKKANNLSSIKWTYICLRTRYLEFVHFQVPRQHVFIKWPYTWDKDLCFTILDFTFEFMHLQLIKIITVTYMCFITNLSLKMSHPNKGV